MPTKPRLPTRTDRLIVARHLRAEATMLRSEVEQWRATPDEAGVLLRLAAQQETRAARFERVAGEMVRE